MRAEGALSAGLPLALSAYSINLQGRRDKRTLASGYVEPAARLFADYFAVPDHARGRVLSSTVEVFEGRVRQHDAILIRAEGHCLL